MGDDNDSENQRGQENRDELAIDEPLSSGLGSQPMSGSGAAEFGNGPLRFFIYFFVAVVWTVVSSYTRAAISGPFQLSDLTPGDVQHCWRAIQILLGPLPFLLIFPALRSIYRRQSSDQQAGSNGGNGTVGDRYAGHGLLFGVPLLLIKLLLSFFWLFVMVQVDIGLSVLYRGVGASFIPIVFGPIIFFLIFPALRRFLDGQAPDGNQQSALARTFLWWSPVGLFIWPVAHAMIVSRAPMDVFVAAAVAFPLIGWRIYASAAD